MVDVLTVPHAPMEKRARAVRSPFKPYLQDYFRRHNITKTEKDVVDILAKYDGLEEDVYRALQENYGFRPVWPPHEPSKEAKLYPGRNARHSRELPPTPPPPQQQQQPQKAPVSLARWGDSNFCCTRCPSCGVLLDLGLPPSVLQHEPEQLQQELRDAELRIADLEAAAVEQQHVPHMPSILPPDRTEIHRLNWILRESADKEKVLAERANLLQMKVIELTGELQRLGEDTGLREQLASRDATIAELMGKLKTATEGLNQRGREVAELQEGQRRTALENGKEAAGGQPDDPSPSPYFDFPSPVPLQVHVTRTPTHRGARRVNAPSPIGVSLASHSNPAPTPQTSLPFPPSRQGMVPVVAPSPQRLLYR